jgi:outer membrane lipopolysaccharide assembly protein LptE/RlpB
MKLIISYLTYSLLMSGCGVYSFSGHGIAGIESISIQPFDNQTAEFGIKEELTDKVLSSLLENRSLGVADRSNADAILFGNLLSVTDRPLTYSSDESVEEYEVVITVSFILTMPDKTEPIWEGNISGVGSYPYSGGSLEEREGGVAKALDRLAEDLINKLTSDW